MDGLVNSENKLLLALLTLVMKNFVPGRCFAQGLAQTVGLEVTGEDMGLPIT